MTAAKAATTPKISVESSGLSCRRDEHEQEETEHSRTSVCARLDAVGFGELENSWTVSSATTRCNGDQEDRRPQDQKQDNGDQTMPSRFV